MFWCFTVCTHAARYVDWRGRGRRTQTTGGWKKKRDIIDRVQRVWQFASVCVPKKESAILLLNCGKIERKAKKSTIINVYRSCGGEHEQCTVRHYAAMAKAIRRRFKFLIVSRRMNPFCHSVVRRYKLDKVKFMPVCHRQGLRVDLGRMVRPLPMVHIQTQLTTKYRDATQHKMYNKRSTG